MADRPKDPIPTSSFNTEDEDGRVRSEKFPTHPHLEDPDAIDETLDRDLENIYADEIRDANRKDLSTWKGILKRRKVALGIVVAIQVLLLVYITVDYTTGWQF